MPIEFKCPACQTSIRTPDGTEGRPARCPRCSAVVVVPGGQPPAPVSEAPPAPGPFAGSPPTTPASTPNPFADKPAAPLNPYAAPSSPFAHDPFQTYSAIQLAERARSRLVVPAVGMLFFAITGLLFMALVALGATLDPDQLFKNIGNDPAQRTGAIGFFIAYFTVGFVTRALQIMGAIAMLRRRGYALALAGAISAVVPCEVYCCLPSLPFGIWALVALNSADVKAAFGR